MNVSSVLARFVGSLVVLLGIGISSARFSRGTGKDYYLPAVM
jgi:hypothetical protein